MREPMHISPKSSWTHNIRGTVYHVISHDRRAADKLFHDYQVEAASGFYFQRRALKAVCWSWHALRNVANTVVRTLVGAYSIEQKAINLRFVVKGALLAQHFAVNSGVPYKYNVDTLSVPFDQSPSCVMAALNLWADSANETRRL